MALREIRRKGTSIAVMQNNDRSHQVRTAAASTRVGSVAVDALRGIHGSAPFGRLVVDLLLVGRAGLVDHVVLMRFGRGYPGRRACDRCSARGEGFGKVLNDLVELSIRDLRPAADHVGDNAAPLLPGHAPAYKHGNGMTGRTGSLHCFAVGPIGQLRCRGLPQNAKRGEAG